MSCDDGSGVGFNGEIPCGGLVSLFADLQAPPEPADELAGEVAQGRVVVVSGGSATVVMLTCSW